LFRIGFRPRLLWDLAHPGLRKVFSLLLPVIFGFAVVQINMLVDTSCAMWIGPGANSSLWYGTRLMQFPLGVFAVAIGSALLPAVSAQMARREFAQASRSITFSLGMIFVVILPCSIGLMVLKTPIVKLLFEYGKFDAESTARASAVLFYYTIGLFAYAGQKIVITGFYSLQDTRTPMKIAVIALVANIAGNLILMFSMKEAGLALSTSISGILQFGLLISCLHRRVSLPLREILSAFLRTLAASCLMGVAAYFTYRALGRAFPGDAAVVRAVQVLGAVGLGTLTFPVFCMIFGVREIRAAGELFMKRIRARRA
jgi:putative peptidoglycan lipid II flippase